MDISAIFFEPIPEFLLCGAQTPPMERLKNVGMNCGCEYTSFPRFSRCGPHSRFDHSLNVARIVWQFTRSPAQALAGLFHDISTPVFSHVVDFLRGDHLKQEATEAGTEELIANSPEIQALLRDLNLSTADVSDYHRYPVADNDAPRLSADRLEYTLGNLVQFGFGDTALAKSLYEDLERGANEDGETELVFRTPEKALSFADLALQCSKIYVSDEDRYAMQMLAELLARALKKGIFTEEDLMKTEPEIISLLRADPEFSPQWQIFCGYCDTISADAPGAEGQWRMIPAKKRAIDPYVKDQGRASSLFPAFGKALEEFRRKPQDYWICGKA